MSILTANIVNITKHEKQNNYFVIRKQGTALYLSDMEASGQCYYSTFPSALQFSNIKTAQAFNHVAEGQVSECNLDSLHPIIKRV